MKRRARKCCRRQHLYHSLNPEDSSVHLNRRFKLQPDVTAMYELFEHKADMGIRGFGKSPEEAFEECAKAMFSVMVELKGVKAKVEVKVEVKAPDVEALLVEWLNALLFEADTRNLFFSEFKVEKIGKKNGGFALHGSAKGETRNLEKHEVKTEVKAATYSGLEVGKKNNKHFAQCIVDV